MRVTRLLSRQEIVNLFKSGASRAEIAEKANITRERVRQIINKIEPELILSRKKSSRERYTPRPCEKCGEICPPRKNTVLRFCLNCRGLLKYDTEKYGTNLDKKTREKVRIEYWQNERKRLWREDSEYRKTHTARVKKNYLERLERAKNDPEYLKKLTERNKKAQKNWYIKKKATNPNFIKENWARVKERRNLARRISRRKRKEEVSV